jgi:hypothetical protein
VEVLVETVKSEGTVSKEVVRVGDFVVVCLVCAWCVL